MILNLELDLSRPADRDVLTFAMTLMNPVPCPVAEELPPVAEESPAVAEEVPAEELPPAVASEEFPAEELPPVNEPIVNGIDTESLQIVDKATVETAVNGLYRTLKKRDEETGGKEAIAMGAFVRKAVADLGAKTIGELDDVLRSKFFEMFRVEYPA